MTTWTVQPATDGFGSWLVERSERSDVWVIAPPGVPLAAGGEIAGWRLGSWETTDGRSASLDRDSPCGERTITTREVLDLLPVEEHQFVFDTLVAQLAAAGSVATPRPGEAIVEDLARLGAQATAWARHELSESFPHDAWPQPNPAAPFPLARVSEPPALGGASATGVKAAVPPRPQPLGRFLADWLRWLLACVLAGLRALARRRHLTVAVGGDRRAAAGSGEPSTWCESDTGELARL